MVYPRVNTPVDVPPETPRGTLFVSVRKTFNRHIKSTKTGNLVSLEDCARGYWTNANLKAAHADECQYLIAQCNGVIEGVWKIDTRRGWLPPADVPKPTWPEDHPHDRPRSGCFLLPVQSEMERQLIGKRVHLGSSPNPVRGYFV